MRQFASASDLRNIAKQVLRSTGQFSLFTFFDRLQLAFAVKFMSAVDSEIEARSTHFNWQKMSPLFWIELFFVTCRIP